MVKKGVSIIIRPLIRTSSSIEKKTFTKLDDYADGRGISKTNLTNRAFWNIFQRRVGTKDLETAFKGDEEFLSNVDRMWAKIILKMNLTKKGLSMEMEKELNKIIDSDED